MYVVNLGLCSDVQVKNEAHSAPETPPSLNINRVSSLDFPNILFGYFFFVFFSVNKLLISVEHENIFCVDLVEHACTEFC